MNVELRHLRSFLVLAEELNFTRAAARLHLAQQALSAQIRQLEEELGVDLFRRTTRKVELTAAGRSLRETIPAALEQLDSVLASIMRNAGECGSLTLGLLATAPLEFTPKLLRSFADLRPNVRVTIRNTGFSDPTGGVLSGQADAALVWEPFSGPGIGRQSLFTDERVAVIPADHPLAALAEIPAEALALEPFVWVDEMDSVARDFWTLADYRAGAPPRIGARITGFEDLFAAIRAGQAVAACPSAIAGALPWPDLVTRKVTGLPPVTVAICWRSGDPNPAVAALAACARRLAVGLGLRDSA